MLRSTIRPKVVRSVAITRGYSVKFAQNFDKPEHKPPTLGDFRYPLLHTFLLASSAFMALNTLWYSLEYEQIENLLVEKSNKLELELQQALDDARDGLTKNRSWTTKLMFWRRQ